MLIKAGDIISKSFELYKKNWQLLLKYASLYLAPTLIITISATVLLPISETAEASIGGSAIYVILAIVMSVISIWFSVVFIKVLMALYQGGQIKNMQDELKNTVPLIFPAILASFFAGLAILGGLLLLIIPGIIFSVWFAFVLYCVVFEEKKGVEALKASKALVDGRWWSVLWGLLLPGLVFAILTMIAQWIVTIPFAFMGTNSLASIIILSIVTTVVSILFIPLSTAAPTILYAELKKTPAQITKTTKTA